MFSGKYIRYSEVYCDYDNHIPAPMFRKSFSVDKPIASSELKISGLGFYELFLNGNKITRGLLSPYISNPDDLVYYDNYDLLNKIETGENVIGVILGNGLQNPFGGSIWDFDKARWRSAPQLAFTLTLNYSDGSSETIESDTSVKTAPSAILFDELRCGMYYDANLEVPGWNTVGFNDSSWKSAEKAPNPRGDYRLCDVDPITVREELSPVDIKEMNGGHLFSFAKNGAGTCRLKINGEKGQKISMYFSDRLFDDGDIDMDSMGFAQSNKTVRSTIQKDIYICKGGQEEFVPFFTYHGYQYIFVEGLKENQVSKETFTYLVLCSDLKEKGKFSCSDEMANKLQEALLRSDLTNFYHFPNDCPHREKNGWTADAALSAEQMLLNFSPERNYAEWLRNICKAQADDGRLPGIVPTAGWGFAWGNGPAWDCVLIYLPYFTYKYRGDKKILEENATNIFRYLHYLTTRMDENGLLSIGLGDWLHANRKDNIVAPLIVTDSMISYDLYIKSATMFDVLGLKAQKEFALSVAADLKTAIRKNLINFNTMTVLGACQTSQAMGIYYDIFEPGEKNEAFRVMLGYIAEADDHIDCGVLGAKAMFRVLSDFGYSSLAFKMITRPDYPSFGNWIAEGFTTLVEGFYPPAKGHVRSISANHHFWGDFGYWFYRYLAGICYNPDDNDITRLNITPSFIDELDEVTAEHDCPYGKISVHWKRQDQIITLEVSIPEELKGYIMLEDGYIFDNEDKIRMPLYFSEGAVRLNGHSQKPLKSGIYTIFQK